MKIIYCLFSLFLYLEPSISLAACPPDWYAFYCRGGKGLSLRNMGLGTDISQTTIMGKFIRNAFSFQQGKTYGLGVGACTWFDRPLSIIESHEFQFPMKTGIISNLAGLTLMQQCASSSKCWFEICAQGTTDGPFTLLPDDITINFE
ncbi:MAG: hypothetical protein ACHQYQ_06050 [Bacteriovoracales bacterium]